MSNPITTASGTYIPVWVPAEQYQQVLHYISDLTRGASAGTVALPTAPSESSDVGDSVSVAGPSPNRPFNLLEELPKRCSCGSCATLLERDDDSHLIVREVQVDEGGKLSIKVSHLRVPGGIMLTGVCQFLDFLRDMGVGFDLGYLNRLRSRKYKPENVKARVSAERARSDISLKVARLESIMAETEISNRKIDLADKKAAKAQGGANKAVFVAAASQMAKDAKASGDHGASRHYQREAKLGKAQPAQDHIAPRQPTEYVAPPPFEFPKKGSKAWRAASDYWHKEVKGHTYREDKKWWVTVEERGEDCIEHDFPVFEEFSKKNAGGQENFNKCFRESGTEIPKAHVHKPVGKRRRKK